MFMPRATLPTLIDCAASIDRALECVGEFLALPQMIMLKNSIIVNCFKLFTSCNQADFIESGFNEAKKIVLNQSNDLKDDIISSIAHCLLFLGGTTDTDSSRNILTKILNDIVLPLKNVKISFGIQISLLIYSDQLCNLPEEMTKYLATSWIENIKQQNSGALASSQLLEALMVQFPSWKEYVLFRSLDLIKNSTECFEPNSRNYALNLFVVSMTRIYDPQICEKAWSILKEDNDYVIILTVLSSTFRAFNSMLSLPLQPELWNILYLGLCNHCHNKVLTRQALNILHESSLWLCSKSAHKREGTQWKKFHSVLDILISETDQNLVGQAWPHIGNLLTDAEAISYPSQSKSCPPGITFSWVSLILSRGIERKFCISGRYEHIKQILDNSVQIPLQLICPIWFIEIFLANIDKSAWVQPGSSLDFSDLLFDFVERFQNSIPKISRRQLFNSFFKAVSTDIIRQSNVISLFLMSTCSQKVSKQPILSGSDIDTLTGALPKFLLTGNDGNTIRILVKVLYFYTDFDDSSTKESSINFLCLLSNKAYFEDISKISKWMVRLDNNVLSSSEKFNWILNLCKSLVSRFHLSIFPYEDAKKLCRLLFFVCSHGQFDESVCMNVCTFFEPAISVLLVCYSHTYIDEVKVINALMLFNQWLEFCSRSELQLEVSVRLCKPFLSCTPEICNFVHSYICSFISPLEPFQLQFEDIMIRSLHNIRQACILLIFPKEIQSSLKSDKLYAACADFLISPKPSGGLLIEDQMLLIFTILGIILKPGIDISMPAHGIVELSHMLISAHFSGKDRLKLDEKRWTILCLIFQCQVPNLSTEIYNKFINVIIEQIQEISDRNLKIAMKCAGCWISTVLQANCPIENLNLDRIILNLWTVFCETKTKTRELVDSVMKTIFMPLKFGYVLELPNLMQTSFHTTFRNMSIFHNAIITLSRIWETDSSTISSFNFILIKSIIDTPEPMGTNISSEFVRSKASDTFVIEYLPRFTILRWLETIALSQACSGNVDMKCMLFDLFSSLVGIVQSGIGLDINNKISTKKKSNPMGHLKNSVGENETQDFQNSRYRNCNNIKCLVKVPEKIMGNEDIEMSGGGAQYLTDVYRSSQISQNKNDYEKDTSSRKAPNELNPAQIAISEELLLNCWQALSILISYACTSMDFCKILDHFSDIILEANRFNMTPRVRYHIECVGGVLLCHKNEKFCSKLLAELQAFNLKFQSISSLMIMIGYALFSDTDEHDTNFTSDIEKYAYFLVPWLGGAHSFTRVLAQLLMYQILTKIPPKNTFFENVYQFLMKNSEVVQMRGKQERIFRDKKVAVLCTVNELLSLYQYNTHRGLNHHLIYESIKNTLNSMQNLQGNARSAPKEQEENKSDLIFQRKIEPFGGKINLNMSTDFRRNEKVKRQPIIVCTSLVSNPVNLGGLARTCEILGVAKLLIENMSILSKVEFSALSLNANQWLPIEELPTDDLVEGIEKAKKLGYCVVTLEQTPSSICLSSFKFPEKTFLIIGDEKRGVPSNLLQRSDYCLQIPQRGVLRSLNCHVSGALAIWEYSKQHMNAD